VRRNLQAELAPDRPGLFVDISPKVDLAAQYHRDELVGRGEILRFDAERILRIGVASWVASSAFKIAERGAAASIEQGLDGSVGMLRGVMDLRDIVDRRDAVVEAAQAS
jgi:hypothetical protein